MAYTLKDNESRKAKTKVEGRLAELEIRLKARNFELSEQTSRAQQREEEHLKQTKAWNAKWANAVEMEESNRQLTKKLQLMQKQTTADKTGGDSVAAVRASDEATRLQSKIKVPF